MFTIGERCNFEVDLDYFRWLISYSWNLGIKRYKQGSDQAKIYIQFCSGLVNQLKVQVNKNLREERWRNFDVFLEMVGPKMMEAN